MNAIHEGTTGLLSDLEDSDPENDSTQTYKQHEQNEVQFNAEESADNLDEKIDTIAQDALNGLEDSFVGDDPVLDNIEEGFDDLQERDSHEVNQAIDQVYGSDFGEPQEDEDQGGSPHLSEQDENDDDLELIESRQISVVEIDSEDEIENLEETEIISKGENPKKLPPVNSHLDDLVLEKPVIVVAGKTEYLLVPELEGKEEYPGFDILFDNNQVMSWLLADFVDALYHSDAFDGLNISSDEDLLKVSFNQVFSITHGDERIPDIALVEVIQTVREYIAKKTGAAELKITLGCDESPGTIYERLSREVGQKRSASFEEEEYDRSSKQMKLTEPEHEL